MGFSLSFLFLVTRAPRISLKTHAGCTEACPIASNCLKNPCSSFHS